MSLFEASGLMTVKEAAAYCRLSPSYFYERERAASFPEFIHIGKQLFFRKEALDRWLAMNTTPEKIDVRT